MKKTITGLSIAFLIFASCSKQTDKQQSGLTTNPNLKSGATGISLSAATTFAQHYLQSKNPNTTITIKNAQTVVNNGIPYFHVINANAGFLILSPDSMYAPILAYDSIGNFSLKAGNINPGLANWFNKHAQELDFVRNNKSVYIDSIAKNNKLLWSALGSTAATAKATNTKAGSNLSVMGQPVEVISSTPVTLYTISNVGPLCPTLWGQDYPFNYYCPAANLPGFYLNHVPAGCVPVAMAQIAYFWKYPNTYNWASMPLTKQAWNSLPAANDCGRLIYNLGINMGITYGSSGSGTDESQVPYGFFSQGYTSATNTASQGQQQLSGADDGTTYSGLITNEIQTYQRPCIVSGFPIYHSIVIPGVLPYPGGTGHSWVCDGSDITTISMGTTYTYHTGTGQIATTTTINSTQSISLLHMNWGWEDDYVVGEDDETSTLLNNNGWYNCSVNYTQSGSNSTDENFQYFQVITYNIHP